MADIRSLAIDLQQDVDGDAVDDDVIAKLNGRSKQDLVSICNELIDGRTLAQAIAAKDKSAILDYVLKAGVNFRDIDETLLHIAVSQKAKNTVKLMLIHGAALSHAADDGKTPLHIAAETGAMQILTEILEYGGKNVIDELEQSGCTALTLACMNGREDAAATLIDHGASIDIKIPYAPLHSSAFTGNVNMIRLLLHKGADINFQDSSGETALHYAAYKGQKKVVQELLKQGAKTDISDVKRKQSIDLAKTEEIRMLLKNHKI